MRCGAGTLFGEGKGESMEKTEENGGNLFVNAKNRKKELRRRMKGILSSFFSGHDVVAESRRVCERFCSMKEFIEADVVLSFSTGNLEIDTSFLNARALASKMLALPKVVSDTQIEFFFLSGEKSVESQLSPGAFGISEPAEGLPPLRLDSLAGKSVVVAVPGIAFTEKGKRCGHGKGYYDRFLSALKKACPNAKAVGICLPCQIVDSVPTDNFDITLDGVCF